MEFHSSQVARYRLLGFENRDVADRDFRNDKVDAGEIGAGHEVTALYEVKLTPSKRPKVADRDRKISNTLDPSTDGGGTPDVREISEEFKVSALSARSSRIHLPTFVWMPPWPSSQKS